MTEISEIEIKSMTKEQNYIRGYKDGKNDVLDKIRAEIEQVAEEESKFDKIWARGLKYALKIIDKYNTEKRGNMTREEKENLLREAVDILIKLDNHLMTSRDNAEFSSWVEDLIDNSRCEEKQEKTRDEKTIDAIDFAIKATDSQDDYGMGMRNGMRYVKSLIDGEQPQYEIRRTDEEIKLGINLGDEVVGDYGAKGVVVGIDTYKGDVMLSLLMSNHKVPQLVKASSYKTKTGRHFPQIAEVLDAILP